MTVEWWANSKTGSVAHALIDGSPVCGRVVIHRDGYPAPDLPQCKRCVAALADPALYEERRKGE